VANRFPDHAFTSRQALDPGLRKVARFLPRGYALHRGYKVQRALPQLMGNAGRLRTVPVVAVNEHVKVRLHRPTGLPDRAPALLWIHGGATIMGGTSTRSRTPLSDATRGLLCSAAVAGAPTMGRP
jgi:acetyl esterase/lipase